MMENQNNEKNNNEGSQEEVESIVSSGHVLDHVQCQAQKVNSSTTFGSTRTPSSLPMKPQSDNNSLNMDPTTIGLNDDLHSKQQQHGSYFANVLPALQMQHAAKLAANTQQQFGHQYQQNQPQQQNNDSFERQFVNQMNPSTSSLTATTSTGVRPSHSISPIPINQFSFPSTNTLSTTTISTGLPTTPIVTSSPSSSLASATRLASMGVGFGPGINPNISNPSSSATGGMSVGGLSSNGMNLNNQNNPPIVNTGNNGPMCVQPGDWICSKCGFVNWRRRRVCMRCYPMADQSNEVSRSIVNGAALAAQLAAGIDPSPEMMASLTTTRKIQPMSVQSTQRSTTPYIQHSYSNLNAINNETSYFTSSSSPSQTASSSPVLNTYQQQNGMKSNQEVDGDESLAWSLQNNLTLSGQYTKNQIGQQSQIKSSFSQSHQNRLFNQPSPLQSPLASSTFDAPAFPNSVGSSLTPNTISSSSNHPSHLIRQSRSSSMLSSLNSFSTLATGSNPAQQGHSKSAFGTPKEEKQFANSQELWFGNIGNGLKLQQIQGNPSNPTTVFNPKNPLPWNSYNIEKEENFKPFSDFNFSDQTNNKKQKKIELTGLNEQIENSFVLTKNKSSNEFLNESIKVSAANEGDEIVVPCGSDLTRSSPQLLNQTHQQQRDKSSFRLLPIGKAAIEPPTTSTPTTTRSNSSSASSLMQQNVNQSDQQQDNQIHTNSPFSTSK